jgi:hypothetical protein
MTAFAIVFGTTARPLYLAHADGHGRVQDGWRPFVWTRDAQRAEKFGSATAAEQFGGGLPNEQWRVVVVPPVGGPSDGGGTPMRLAA